MADQKGKKTFSEGIFGIFECLLPQNPSNKSSLLSWFFKTNKDDIWQGGTLPRVLLKKSIMAVQKCKTIPLQAALKDFSSSANPKLKKLSLP